jgi:hypothetical protein
MKRPVRSPLVLASGALVAASMFVIATVLPVAGQDPTASPTPAATEKPGQGPKTDKPDKVPEVAVSLSGRVGTMADEDGSIAYTLTVGTTVYDLHVGPPWWWGENHPLKDLVGKTASVTGERAEGSLDVDVFAVNGKVLREAGRPPWAGGWKVVGERHPGWAQWKVDKAAEKAQGKGAGRPSWAGPKTPEDAGD